MTSHLEFSPPYAFIVLTVKGRLSLGTVRERITVHTGPSVNKRVIGLNSSDSLSVSALVQEWRILSRDLVLLPSLDML